MGSSRMAIAVAALLLVGVVGWRMRRGHGPMAGLPAAFPGVMPRRVVWAWEEPEDLRDLPATVGVAVLAETLVLGRNGMTVVPRRQMVRPGVGASVMAVVRVETRPGFVDSAGLRSEVAGEMAGVAARNGARALQVDFDAGESERGFYAGMLGELRVRVPAGVPLSMTALVSWCGGNSWLRGLPVAEAVPMYFRMGGPRAMAAGQGGARGVRVTEPLCRGSLGVSTDEPWPRGMVRRVGEGRVYVFAPQPWRRGQMEAMAGAPMGELEMALGRGR